MGEFPSGQWGQTVNLLRLRFDGSNPSSPTNKNDRRIPTVVFVCGFERMR